MLKKLIKLFLNESNQYFILPIYYWHYTLTCELNLLILSTRSSSAVASRPPLVASGWHRVGVSELVDWVVGRGNRFMQHLRTCFVSSSYTTPTGLLLRRRGGGGTTSMTVASMGVGTRFAAAAAVALSARERRRTGGRAGLFKDPSELIRHSLAPFLFPGTFPLPDLSWSRSIFLFHFAF